MAPSPASATLATVLHFPSCPTRLELSPPPALAPDERIVLDRLRWLALRSLVSPRPDFERACFLLAGESDVSLTRYGAAFFHGLSEHARRPMVFYRPGARSVSDDETWLLRLLGALRAGHASGAKALVAWRVTPASQRWIRFLAAGLADMLEKTGQDHPSR